MDECQKSAAHFFSQYAFFRRFCGGSGGGVAQNWLILCNCMRQQLYDSKAGKQARSFGCVWCAHSTPTRTPSHQHYYLRLSALLYECGTLSRE
jgi:hypothetical protein